MAELWRLTITGLIQAGVTPAARFSAMLSVRETAIASLPLKACSERVELKFEARLE